MVVVDSVSFSYGDMRVLDGVSLSLASGDFVGVLGPNGSGKTTLVRCISGVVRLERGSVRLSGRDITTLRRRDIARMLAIVPQSVDLQFDFTVEEYVLMGRLPHLERFEREGPADLEKVEWAMRVTETGSFRDRPVTSLSGGERQRVALAKALAQDPKVLMLDEPTSHLDLRYQVEVLDLVKQLNREHGIAVLAVMHDANLASAYCRDIVMLSDGKVLAAGPKDEVLSESNLGRLYGLRVISLKHPLTEDMLVFPAFDGVRVAAEATPVVFAAPSKTPGDPS